MAKRHVEPQVENEVEERLVLRKAMYATPGTTEHRGPTPRARASANRMDKAPKGAVQPDTRSQRSESRKAEAAAEEHNNRVRTPEEMFAFLDKENAAKQRAKEVAAQRIGFGREDFRWRIDRETGEAEYVKYEDANGAAWKDV